MIPAIGGGLLVIAGVVALILSRDPAALKRARVMEAQMAEFERADKLQAALEKIDAIAATAQQLSHPEMDQILKRAQDTRLAIETRLALRKIDKIAQEAVHARATVDELRAVSDRLLEIGMEHPNSLEVKTAIANVDGSIAEHRQALKRQAEARLVSERAEAGRQRLRELQQRLIPLVTESRFAEARALLEKEGADIAAIEGLAPLVEAALREILRQAEDEFGRHEAMVTASLEAGNLPAARRALERISDGYGVTALEARAKQMGLKIDAAQREVEAAQYRLQREKLDQIALAAINGLREFRYSAAKDAVSSSGTFEGVAGREMAALREGVRLQDLVFSKIVSGVVSKPYALSDVKGTIVRADQTHCVISLGRGGAQAQARREWSGLSARDLYGLAESVVEQNRDELTGLLLFAGLHATKTEAAKALALLEKQGFADDAELAAFNRWLEVLGVAAWTDLTEPAEQPATVQVAAAKVSAQPGVMPGFENLGDVTIDEKASYRPCVYCEGSGLIRTRICTDCDGVGVNCTVCNRTGRVAFICGTCGGNGTIMRGASSEPCPACKGKGRYPCAHCAGEGQVKVPNRERHKGVTTDCPTCLGSGHSGDASCFLCGGNGEVRNYRGRGYWYGPCRLCKGTGRSLPRCSACRGLGYVGHKNNPSPCMRCTGTGLFYPICPTCRGAGWIPLR